MTVPSAIASGTFLIGGDLAVNRLGYGVMQLPGKGVWGPSRDPEGAIQILREAVDLGVTLIDTADSYGPFVADHLIRQALYPYPPNLVIATKVGFTRQGPDRWTAVGRPEYLRQQVELNLRHLGVERIDLLQLHRIDPKVPLEDQLGELVALQHEGKIRHLGLSEVSVAQIRQAERIAAIVSVQNRYNLAERSAEPVLEYAQSNGIAFIPWFPLATGRLVRDGSPLATLAKKRGLSPAQLALAWLLHRSEVMLPIPGTANIQHLRENVASAGIVLDDDEYDQLIASASVHGPHSH